MNQETQHPWEVGWSFNVSGYTWSLDGRKFLAAQEVEKLRRHVVQLRRKGVGEKDFHLIRDWFLVETGLATGSRLMELRALKCGDLLLTLAIPEVVVRHGKNGKRRVVKVNRRYAARAAWYLKTKAAYGQGVGEEAPLFVGRSRRKPLSRRQIHNVFTALCRAAKLSRNYGIHCLRHTYATNLYRSSGRDLRLVQKQLGHSRITTTEIYADVMDEDAQAAVEALYRIRRKTPEKNKEGRK